MWTPPYCPKFQPTELAWGAGKKCLSGMYFSMRNRATTRPHLCVGFYGGKDSQEATWGPANVAGCWARAEKGMAYWIAAGMGQPDGSLAGAITDLHGVGNWTTSGDNCPGIADMECTTTPSPLTRPPYRPAQGTRKFTATAASRAQRKRRSGSDTAVAWRACGVFSSLGPLGGGAGVV